MPVFNGARHLRDQLDSLAKQTVLPSGLIVSDDGSTDQSRDIVTEFQKHAPFPVQLRHGPRRGYPQNVMALLQSVPNGMIGFCDQDDIWLPDRIARGLEALATQKGLAIHVAARASIGGQPRRQVPRPPDMFATALIQNLAPANATLMNEAAARIIRQLMPGLRSAPPFPDWWIFGVIAGIEGQIIFDPKPGLLYREHGGNLLGDARSVSGIRRRIHFLCSGQFGAWLHQNTRALMQVRPHLAPPAMARLSEFSEALLSGRARDWLALSDRTGSGEKLLLRAAAGMRLI